MAPTPDDVRHAHVLGRVRLVSTTGEEVALPSGRPGELLRWLLLRPNETHAAETLIELLWSGDPDASTSRLQVVVSRLRSLLGAGRAGGLRVATDRDGYRLQADAATLDRVAFETLAARALAGEPALVADALALWDGAPYSGMPVSDESRRQVAHLVEIRRQLEESREERSPLWSLRRPLVRTKLLRPRVDTLGVIGRPRLLDRAGKVGDAPIVTVTAPAGYGKSTFLSQWAEAQTAPVGWVTLDADDNDPVRFWSAVFHGLDHADGLDLSAMPDATPGSQRFIEALLDTLARSDTPVGLVLDDFHTIDNADLVNDLRRQLIDFPAWLTVAVGTREPVTVDDVDGLVELRGLTADDLRFEPDEVADVMRLGGASDAYDVAAILRVTDGWPVAVSHLLRPGIRIDAGTLAAELDDYVVDEVLVELPCARRQFLLRTAHLDRLHASLCDAVTGGTDSQDQLEWLLGRELFVAAIRGDIGWSRYRPVVAEVLRRRAQADPDVDVTAGLRRAARWCRDNGLDDEALQYGIAGGEDDVVAALAGPVLHAAAARGEAYRCERLLTVLDPEVVAADRSSHDVAMLLVAGLLDPDRSEPWLASRRRFSAGGGEDGEGDVMAMWVVAHRLLAQGSPRRAMAVCEAAVARADAYFGANPAPAGFAELTVATLQLGALCSRMMTGLVGSGDAAVRAAVRHRRRGNPAMTAWILGEAALLAYVEGDQRRATALVERVDDLLATMDPQSAVLGATRAIVTRALVESDASDDPEVQRGIAARLHPLVSRCERLGRRTDLVPVLLALQITCFRAGDVQAAAEHAAHADIVIGLCEDVPLLATARRCLDTGLGTPEVSVWVELSDRQRVVLDHLEAGSTYAQIAEATGSTLGSVRSAVRSIYAALGVRSRHEAVRARRTMATPRRPADARGGSGAGPPPSDR